MNRKMALQIALVVVGILFLATAYPLVALIRQEPAISMMMSLYVTLGIFLLLAIRNPSANRSLILFTAWSSLAHAGVMGFQGMRHFVDRSEMIGVAILAVIGVVLLVLAPGRAVATAQIGNPLPTRQAAAK